MLPISTLGSILCLCGGFIGVDADLSQFVNVFQRTSRGGNRFLGVVAAPFSMIKLGSDVQNGIADAYSGYLPEGKVWGYSMMHESGTGGAPKYGVVSQILVVGTVSNPLADLSQQRTSPDEGSVGYYKSTLTNGVTVELAATEHASLYSYSFPGTRTASLVIDVSHVVPSFRGLGWEQHYSKRRFKITDEGYEGSGTYNNGWNLSPDWTVYFCGQFNQQPSDWWVFSSSRIAAGAFNNSAQVSGNERLGGVFSFDKTSLTSSIGISFISTKKACQNLDGEITNSTELKSLIENAKRRWNEQVLDKVQVLSSNSDDLKLIYSSLYGMFLIPSNRTGENLGWTSREPYYDDVFTL